MEQPKVRKTIALKLKDPGGVRASDAVKITKKPEAGSLNGQNVFFWYKVGSRYW